LKLTNQGEIMNDQSIKNKHINDETGVSTELQNTVLKIYRNSLVPLTTNEMLQQYYQYVSTIPASDPKHKILMSARHNGLKAARTHLTHKGLIRETNPKVCSVSNREVSAFRYVGVEYTKLEKLRYELQRRRDDLTRIEKRITELTIEIGALEREAA